MKLKSKLIMSGVALAACAATLTSTTYAWYTSNTNVTAQGLSGATATSGSELLLISQDATAATRQWYTSIEDATPVANNSLSPLQYTATTKVEESNTVADTSKQGVLTRLGVTGSTDQTTDYISYVFYLKNASTKAASINMEITSLKNTTGVTKDHPAIEYPAKSVVGPNHKYIGIAETEPSYTVDMLRVLCMEVEVEKQATNTGGYSLESDTAYKLFAHNSADSVSDSLSGLTPSASQITDATGKYSAHQYYNEVMGLTSNGTTVSGKSPIALTDSTYISTSWAKDGKINLGNIPTAGEATNNMTNLKVTVKLFLNGWDLACFDACQGQTFDLGLKFTTATAIE